MKIRNVLPAVLLLAFCGTLYGAMSEPVSVDNTTGGALTLPVGATLDGIAWSSLWEGGTAAVVKVDGTEIANGTGEGVTSWTAPRLGTYVLTHETLPGGETLSVTVEVQTSNRVTSVTCRQRWPWNGLVDIDYVVEGDDAVAADLVDGLLSAMATSGGRTVALQTLSGEVTAAAGTHRMTWDSSADWPELDAEDVQIRLGVVSDGGGDGATYCVIDLSGGANAIEYPVAYLNKPPAGGFNTDAYKTTNLVLKLCPRGTFIMGDDQTDESHRVTLTKPFYMGLFEVTQRQWELVTGGNPSYDTGVGNAYPVHYVSYNMIRGSSAGTNWPAKATVDAGSFLGKLRARTGLDFDLPTEAQWEYACRAGTTTTYSYGNSASGDYMWYDDNSDWETHPVGGKKANPWGLYDMHGNVWEWCLDWFAWDENWDPILAYGTDPKGSSSGSFRVLRGGGWNNNAGNCTSSYRYGNIPSSAFSNYGFRLARTLQTQNPPSAASRQRAAEADAGGCTSAPFRVEAGVANGPVAVLYGTQAVDIAWSSLWDGGDTAMVKVDGAELARGAGEGEADWTPDRT